MYPERALGNRHKLSAYVSKIFYHDRFQQWVRHHAQQLPNHSIKASSPTLSLKYPNPAC
jgi:hypothetical protein